MKYFFKKTYRDIAKNWIQFLAVFMMALLSITIYSGMEGVWYGLDEVTSEYYKDTNIADYWIYTGGASTEQIENLKNVEGIADLNTSMAITVKYKDEKDNENNPSLKLRTLSDSDSISLFLLQEGSEFSEAYEDSVWLDLNFAREHNINVGDRIVISYMTMEKELTVKGLVLSSEYIYYTGSTTEIVPNHYLYGYCFTSEKTIKNFLGKTIINEIRVKCSETVHADYLKEQAKTILGENYLDTIYKDDILAVSQVKKEVRQMRIMAQMFSAVFILLALLTMYTTMSRLIDTQRVEIGLFKALGFSNKLLRFHYAFYGIIISALGGYLGSVLGPLIVSPAVMRIKKATLVLPKWEKKISVYSYLIAGVIVIICVASCIIASQKILKEVPAVSMRNKAPKGGSKILFEHIPSVWKIFSSEWKWIFRDINRAKLRTIIGIVGVAGGLTLIVAGFGFSDSINNSNNYVYQIQNKYDEKLLLNRTPTEEETEEINRRSKKYQWLMEKSSEFTYGDKTKKGLLCVIDEGDLLYFENLKKSEVTMNDDCAFITKRLAERLNIKTGDEVEVHIIGTQMTFTVKINEIIYSPSPQGLYITKNSFIDKNGEFEATSVLVANDSDVRYLDIGCVQEAVTKEAQKDNMNTMSKSVMTIIKLLIIASLILSVVIIYNLGALNYIERYREYATMKVLGFYQMEIRALMLRENILILVAGLIIGTPISIKFLKEYIGIVAFEAFEWVPQIDLISFVICVSVIVACSIITTLVLSHKVKKIVMVEALKSVE